MSQCESKSDDSSWPELVGLPWKEAEDAIKRRFPKIAVYVLPEGSAVTMDYREDRVRVFTDKDGNVASTPMIG